MHPNEPIVGLLIAFLLLVVIARRIRVAPPIALVAGGLVLGFVPGLPTLALDPELILLAFIPPLLFWEASLASWRDVKKNLRPITLLSVGLMFVTMLTVAVAAHALLPGLPWPAAFVLGAAVSPTDPVTLLSITQRLPIPQRIIDVLVGESLVNDATALVAFRFALAATAAGSFYWQEVVAPLIYVVLGGLVIGLVCAWAILRSRRFLALDSLHDNLMLLLTPFVIYMIAQASKVSAALAVVVSGLYIGRRAPIFLAARTRLQGNVLWEMIVFVLNGLLFVLVGLQLQTILQQPLAHSLMGLIGIGATVTVVVIVTRLVCVFPAVMLPRALGRAQRAQNPMPPVSHVWLLGWTGMRGGVSLAIALAIPALLPDGTPFPGRNEIVLITYFVILGTLCLQGLTLPLVIRALHLTGDDAHEREEATARLEVAQTALKRLDELAIEHDIPSDLYDGLRTIYLERADRLQARRNVRPDSRLEARVKLLDAIKSEVLEAERLALIRLRDRGDIGDEVLRHLQTELDQEAVQTISPQPHGPGR